MVMGVLLYAPLFHPDFNQSLLLADLSFLLPSFSSKFYPLFTHFQDLVQIGPHEGVWELIRCISHVE